MRSHGKTYLHVGNSGATFEVGDEGHGPKIDISMGAFGNLKTRLEINTTNEGLEELGLMLLEASRARYSEPYCHAAEPASRRRTHRSSEVGNSQGMQVKGPPPSAEQLELEARARAEFDYVHTDELISTYGHDERLDTPRPWYETVMGLLKARAIFDDGTPLGRFVERNDLHGEGIRISWRDIEELAQMGFLYAHEGKVGFRFDKPLVMTKSHPDDFGIALAKHAPSHMELLRREQPRVYESMMAKAGLAAPPATEAQSQ